jgi:hypothetical protein
MGGPVGDFDDRRDPGDAPGPGPTAETKGATPRREAMIPMLTTANVVADIPMGVRPNRRVAIHMKS